ncbi:MAG: DUF4340 domain-containing protein [Myxococcota bacterium]
MKRTLIGLLLGVIALGLVTWLVTRKPETPAPKTLTITGYATKAQLDAEAQKSVLAASEPIDYPVDQVVIERDGQTVELKRTGEGKELTWALTAPMAAPAVRYQVEQIVRVFKDPSASVYSKTVADKDLGRYGLDAAHRVGLKLVAGGATWNGVDLWVGKAEKAKAASDDQDSSSDTWVAQKSEPTTVYRISGKDLRAPLEVKLSELRDKKLLDVKAEDLVHIEVSGPDGAKLVLDGARVETPGATPEAPPKHEVTWTVTEPAGQKTDDSAAALARNISGARAQEFVAAADAPADAMGAAFWKVSARTHDGKEVALDIADGDTDPVWARVAGGTELVKLDKFTAQNLRKTLADVRDKAMFDLTPEQVTRIRFAPETGGPVTVEQQGAAWRFVSPAESLPADPSSHIPQMVTTKANRYARPDETAQALAALAAPDFTAELDAGDQKYQVAFGPVMEDEPYARQRWARVTRQGLAGDPVLVADFSAGRFRKAAADLRLKKLFEVTPEQVQSLTITPPGGADAVTLTREGDALVLAPLPAGKKTKAMVVTTVLGTLGSLKAKAVEPGKPPATVGLTPTSVTTIEAALTDGSKLKLELGPKADEGDPWAVARTGPLAGVSVQLNSFQADNLRKTAAELVE